MNVAIFINTIRQGQIAEALQMLLKLDDTSSCRDEAIAAIKAVDTKTKTTLMHQLAQLAALNNALLAGSVAQEDAKKLLRLVMQHSDLRCQEKSSQRTAFSDAVFLDHRATAAAMLSVMSDLRRQDLLAVLKSQDHKKNTVLHYAIDTENSALIEALLKIDSVDYMKTDFVNSLYFCRNKEGLFSLAFALKNYQEHPSILSLTLINQLYFTLPQGVWRTQAVEADINMGWGFFSKPLWKYALRLCAKRDRKNTIKEIDLSLLDLIVQAVKDGLRVMDMKVTMEIVYDYSESQSGTPGQMLRDAEGNRQNSLAGRTLTQAATNHTLAENKEFMQRAPLEEMNYYLCTRDTDPTDPKNLAQLKSDREWIVLYNQRLFYIPKQESEGSEKSRACQEIMFDGLSADDIDHFKDLRNAITIVGPTCRKAESNEIKHILPLVPFIAGQSHRVATTKSDHSCRITGMTFFGNTAQAASSSSSSSSLSPLLLSSSSSDTHVASARI